MCYSVLCWEFRLYCVGCHYIKMAFTHVELQMVSPAAEYS